MKRIIILLSFLIVPATALNAASTKIDSDLEVTGASTLTGAITATGGITGDITGNVTGNIEGDTVIDGVVTYEPSAVVVIDTSTALTITDRYMLVLAKDSAEIVSDATPFISTNAYTQGTQVTIMNTGGTLTLSDTGTVSGSLLELDGTTVALTNLSNITLYLKGNAWVQVGGVNIID